MADKKQNNNQKSQSAKFVDLARQIGADEDPDAFKAKLVKVAKAPRSSKAKPS